MPDVLHFRLRSGRVLLLNSPLSPEELEEAQTDAGMALLEALADAMERRCLTEIDSDSPQGIALLSQHNLSPAVPAATQRPETI